MILTFQQSYFLYLSAIGISLFSALSLDFWSRYFRVSVASNVVIFLVLIISFLPLILVSGFRFELGVDYYSYVSIYDKASSLGFFGYYFSGTFIEPGYLALQRLLYLFGIKSHYIFLINTIIGHAFPPSGRIVGTT